MLVLDGGNSQLKWGYWQAGAWQATGHLPVAALTPATLAQAWREVPGPTRIVGVAVAGAPVTAAVAAWCEQHGYPAPVFFSATAMAGGVRNAYADPARLGADRWAALLAGHHHYPGALCIADVGTALTLDVLAADGRHHGGQIVPGPALLRTSLYQATRGIPDEGESGLAPFGQDTRSGVTSGAWYATAATIERAHAEAQQLLRTPVQLLLTGGAAQSVLPLLRIPVVHDEHLVLRGVLRLAEAMI